MPASNYTEQNHLHAMLRGVAYPLPTGTYVALHTADPTDAALAATEVQAADWPSYVRRKAEGVGAIGSGWSAWVDGVGCKNTNQLTYPGMDGAAPVTITHWSVWDAATGGNMLTSSPTKNSSGIQTTRTLDVGDVFVFDANSLTINQS